MLVRMRRIPIAAVVLALASCASPQPAPLPSPSVAVSSAASITPRTIRAGELLVRLNGLTISAVALTYVWSDGPITIDVTFPLPVDRTSAEQALRGGLRDATVSWDGDARVVAQVADYANTYLDLGGTRARDGSAMVERYRFPLGLPALGVVELHRMQDLSSGVRVPVPHRAFALRRSDGIAVSPDAARALLFDSVGSGAGPAPRVVDLASGAWTELGVPADEGPFAFGGWLPDEMVLLVGRSVWLARAGEPSRAVASFGGARPTAARPSPLSRFVAVSLDDEIALVDLRSGGTRRLSGPFRACTGQALEWIAWSPDERMLAVADCEQLEPRRSRARVVEVTSGREVRVHEGAIYGVNDLNPLGYVIVVRSEERGAGARHRGIRYDWQGTERARYLGLSWSVSPDGRYIVQVQPSQGFSSIAIIESATGSTVADVGVRGFVGGWTRAGELIVIR